MGAVGILGWGGGRRKTIIDGAEVKDSKRTGLQELETLGYVYGQLMTQNATICEVFYYIV